MCARGMESMSVPSQSNTNAPAGLPASSSNAASAGNAAAMPARLRGYAAAHSSVRAQRRAPLLPLASSSRGDSRRRSEAGPKGDWFSMSCTELHDSMFLRSEKHRVHRSPFRRPPARAISAPAPSSRLLRPRAARCPAGQRAAGAPGAGRPAPETAGLPQLPFGGLDSAWSRTPPAPPARGGGGRRRRRKCGEGTLRRNAAQEGREEGRPDQGAA